ncbi:hypothetical protein ACS5PU_15120 [Pedobacter sp. GSP4]|uniref:hypothetical protein n=1 Tax=Pedobacter sp. GSP4 TaxID=3453716 RepID=UPI003EE8D907
MKNLTIKEMTAINGDSTTQNISISASSSTASLLELSFEQSDGDKYQKTGFSAGNHINLNLLFAGFNQKS